MSKALVSLAIFIVVVVVVGLGLNSIGMPEALTTAVVGGVFGIYPTLATSLTDRKKTNQERIAELVKGYVYTHPVLVTFYIFCYLQFVERTLGFVFGAAIATAIAASGQATQETANQIVYMVSPIFVDLVLTIAIIPIAIYSTHRVKRFPFLWIASAVLIDQIVGLTVAALILQVPLTMEAVVAQAVIAALLIPGALIGIFWARRTHLNFIMARLFKRLTRPDQHSLIELVDTLPKGSIG
jgi:hypothetical protein